jgi:hypothetical protein
VHGHPGPTDAFRSSRLTRITFLNPHEHEHDWQEDASKVPIAILDPHTRCVSFLAGGPIRPALRVGDLP